MSNKTLDKFFKIMAVILVGVAAVFLWLKNYDGVFVSAALGCVSYFLSFRFQVKERLDIREAERKENELLEERELFIENYRGGLFEDKEEGVEIIDLASDNQKEKLPVEK
jgi:hypothetical protein